MGQRCDKRMDRISNLPVEVIDAILVRLPLKDAVRTSILSSKWKDKWVTLSELFLFTRNMLSREYLCNTEDGDVTDKIVTIVDQVLLLHQGRLQKFIFSCFLLCYSPIDRWIIHLSRKGVKEISISARPAGVYYVVDASLYYKVSSRLFDCQEITSLALSFCVVRLPPSFEVFPNLKSLELFEVVWDKCDINKMTSKCPLLERLMFLTSTVTSIKINNPNLEFLDISGAIAAIHFESAPLLSEMCFGMAISGPITVLSVSSILQSLCHFSNIKTLNLGTATPLPGSLCSELKMPPLCNLENLSVDISFEDQNDISALLCLLRTSSGLLKLVLRGRYKNKDSSVAAGCFKAWKDLNWKLNKLVEVSITDISGVADADTFKFIKVVLANSPVLQKLTIFKWCEDVSIVKKLLQFQRASPEAKIFWI